jgi:malonyl CoA-acyl carrier protein transacylase
MEKANLHQRLLSESQKVDLRQAVRKIGQLTAERRTAGRPRAAAIDAEIRTLNQHCDAVAIGRAN